MSDPFVIITEPDRVPFTRLNRLAAGFTTPAAHRAVPSSRLRGTSHQPERADQSQYACPVHLTSLGRMVTARGRTPAREFSLAVRLTHGQRYAAPLRGNAAWRQVRSAVPRRGTGQQVGGDVFDPIAAASAEVGPHNELRFTVVDRRQSTGCRRRQEANAWLHGGWSGSRRVSVRFDRSPRGQWAPTRLHFLSRPYGVVHDNGTNLPLEI